MTTKSRVSEIYDNQRSGPDANKMVRKSEIIQKPRNDRLDLNQPSAQLNTSNRRALAGEDTSANDYYILS